MSHLFWSKISDETNFFGRIWSKIGDGTNFYWVKFGQKSALGQICFGSNLVKNWRWDKFFGGHLFNVLRSDFHLCFFHDLFLQFGEWYSRIIFNAVSFTKRFLLHTSILSFLFFRFFIFGFWNFAFVFFSIFSILDFSPLLLWIFNISHFFLTTFWFFLFELFFPSKFSAQFIRHNLCIFGLFVFEFSSPSLLVLEFFICGFLNFSFADLTSKNCNLDVNFSSRLKIVFQVW